MKELEKRKNIRLKEYNYSEEGYYFVTICTKDRKNIFSKIEKCRGDHWSSVLTQNGKIIDMYIKEIEEVYKNIKIDEYIIMPNHVHILMNINKNENITLSRIIQQFKGKTTKEIRYPVWQKSFYEHIVRNEKEYIKIKEYIINNPENWEKDKYY